MKKMLLTTLLLCLGTPVLAQQTSPANGDQETMIIMPSQDKENGAVMEGATDMNASGAMMQDMQAPVSEPGQGAFAAIAEIVAKLKADPKTDWSRVNIDALREHLRDMDIVTIDSHATADPVAGGIRFAVTGAPDVIPSIRRMVTAHAGVMNGVDGWTYEAEETENGANLTIFAPEKDLLEIRALGFYGLLAGGMHHQPHHWMMATGTNPHG